MIKVDAGKFRWHSALAALDDGIAEVEGDEAASDALKERFRAEAAEWRSSFEASIAGDVEIAQAWGVVDSQTLRLLDLVLEASDETWAEWRDDASEGVETFGVLLAMPQTLESSDLVVPDLDGIEVVGAAEVYTSDLPDTPARWRSLSVLRQMRAERMSDLDALIASVREAVVSGLRQRLLAEASEAPSSLFALLALAAGKRPKALLTGNPAYERLLGVSSRLMTGVLASQFTRYDSVEFDGLNSYIAEIEGSVVPAPVRRNLSPSPEVRAGFAVDVLLEDAGDAKLQVIKTIRDLTSLGIGEAKAIVDHGSRSVVLEGVSNEAAAAAKAALEQAGATVTLRAVVSGTK